MPRKINSEVIGRDRYGVFPLRGKILNAPQSEADAN